MGLKTQTCAEKIARVNGAQNADMYSEKIARANGAQNTDLYAEKIARVNGAQNTDLYAEKIVRVNGAQNADMCVRAILKRFCVNKLPSLCQKWQFCCSELQKVEHDQFCYFQFDGNLL